MVALTSITMTASGKTYDLAIIGGGIVASATARHLKLRHPKLSVCMLEKENELATHQSHRNSGVIHRGIYYKPNTIKSKLCIDGSSKIFQYCIEKNIPVKKCGKLILACDSEETNIIRKLFDNCLVAGIEDVELIGKNRILKIQPGCSASHEALWSPSTGIVDWKQVANCMANDFISMGGIVMTGFKVDDLKLIYPSLIEILQGSSNNQPASVKAKRVIVCAGLQSDVLAEASHCDSYPKIVPFRGDYLLLKPELAKTIKTNLYPAPNPRVPFLGVHITPRIDGSVIVGPNAMLSFGRESYDSGLTNVGSKDAFALLTTLGLYKLLLRPDYIRAGLDEIYRLISRRKQIEQLRKFLPQMNENDICFTNHCGIRAQCVDRDGNLVDDFIFDISDQEGWKNVLNVRNCPSPAATSSLSIAEHIVDIVESRLQL